MPRVASLENLNRCITRVTVGDDHCIVTVPVVACAPTYSLEVIVGLVLARIRVMAPEEKVACRAALGRFLALEAGAGTPELAAEDLRLAARALGRITGRVDVDDVLDLIFRDFCIGK